MSRATDTHTHIERLSNVEWKTHTADVRDAGHDMFSWVHPRLAAQIREEEEAGGYRFRFHGEGCHHTGPQPCIRVSPPNGHGRQRRSPWERVFLFSKHHNRPLDQETAAKLMANLHANSICQTHMREQILSASSASLDSQPTTYNYWIW